MNPSNKSEPQRQRSFWGWGWEDRALTDEQATNIAAAAASRMGKPLTDAPPMLSIPRIEEIELSSPRISPPSSLAPLFTSSPLERASHTYGKSFKDVLRALIGDFAHAPDLVAIPRKECASSDIAAILEWCSEARIAAIPYGGGSSVVGGVEPAISEDYTGCVSIDLRQLSGVQEVDECSRTACILGGTLGPQLEDELKPFGLTLRHFPQSFEFSTLGGWIATRSGGHYVSLYTHIDDFVEALEVLTPRGELVTRRLPGSGAGPSPDRLFIGSEGTLGIITKAWVRLQRRPTYRAAADVRFSDFYDAVEAVRMISQASLYPANCRLLDPLEALLAGGDGKVSILVLAFESADHPVEQALLRAVEIAKDAGGQCPSSAMRIQTPNDAENMGSKGAAGSWRTAFLRAPYGRDALVRAGFVTETFETAITWERFFELHTRVLEEVRGAIQRVCGGGWVACRFTHIYPDGPAPYYTVVAWGHEEPSARLSQWEEIKQAASDAIISMGATITHHHAVGRDHKRWYEIEVPPLYREALRAAKASLDPAGILNPGALVDPL